MKLLQILSVLIIFSACKQKEIKAPSKIVIPQINKISKNPYTTMDQSPMDIAYYPANYPMSRMKQQDTFPLVARVIYSRPHKNGRKIFGDDAASVCKYGIPWRLGANEATEIEFFRNVKLGGKNIEAGRYVMYCIPYADRWIVKLNTLLFTWGLHIDPSQNVLTVEAQTQSQAPVVEDFTMVFHEEDDQASLLMAWDTVKVLLPISLK